MTATDKLQAAINHDWPDADQDFPPDYVAACRAWYAALSAGDKATAEVVRATFEKGEEAEAEKLAASLPAAPAFPL